VTRTVPELLAPAGNFDALKAACDAGADSVYLGGARFGARAAASFDRDALFGAIEYAHSRDVAVYVTVNTLVTERELPLVAEELVAAFETGADAVLVHDPGVASIARELVPDLPLHASTQMTVHSAYGVRAAADLGCTRVVLARELHLTEIEAIARDVPGIEIEVFAHGALCYAWSGQCLLSSAIGGRSGNRGRCAQPCRKPYSLLSGTTDGWGRLTEPSPVPLGDRYLLSPRDLWTYPVLSRLARSPIAALKIEGRLRSPRYVADVVGCYRRALDRIAEDTFVPLPEEEDLLRLAFNRGFTIGRLFGETGDRFMGRDRPGSRGIPIGEVIGLNHQGLSVVRLREGVRLEPGDGLAAFPSCRPDLDTGVVLRRAVTGDTVSLAFNRPVPVGTPVHLTGRNSKPTSSPIPRVYLDLSVSFHEDRPVAVGSVANHRGLPVPFRVVGDSMTAARTRPLTSGTFEQQLRRTGGTPFAFRSIAIDLPKNLFAPPSALNEFRRRILEAAAASLVASRRPGSGTTAAARVRLSRFRLSQESFRGPFSIIPRVRCLVDSVDGTETAAEAGADEICIEPLPVPSGSSPCPTWEGEAIAEMLVDSVSRCAPVPVIWAWPRVTTADFLAMATPVLPLAGVAGVLVNGAGAGLAVRSGKPSIPVHGGPGLNVWNSRTVRRFEPLFTSLTLSPELSRQELSEAVAVTRGAGGQVLLGVIVQGNLEVMVSEDCLPGLAGCLASTGTRFALEDERRRRFPVLQDGACRSRILNSVETCLIDHIPALASAGVDLLVVDARGRTPAWTAAAVRAYRAGVNALGLPASRREAVLGELKEDLRTIAWGGLTSSLYIHGRREGQTLLPVLEHDTTCHRSSS